MSDAEIIHDDNDCMDCGAKLNPCRCQPDCPGGECSVCMRRDLREQVGEIRALRSALAEALTAWESWCSDQQHSGMDMSVFDRIAELRKLTRHRDEEG